MVYEPTNLRTHELYEPTNLRTLRTLPFAERMRPERDHVPYVFGRRLRREIDVCQIGSDQRADPRVPLQMRSEQQRLDGWNDSVVDAVQQVHRCGRRPRAIRRKSRILSKPVEIRHESGTQSRPVAR